MMYDKNGKRARLTPYALALIADMERKERRQKANREELLTNLRTRDLILRRKREEELV